MIKKFHTYIKENVDDLDPYGEEDWNDPSVQDFEIGDKVECIDSQGTYLEQNKVYTVKWVVQKRVLVGGYLYLEDEPIVNLDGRVISEIAYKMRRFKKT